MQYAWEEYLRNVSGGCFFRLLPSFCDGKNYSPPWQISIKSIWKEEECWEQNMRIELRRVGEQKVQRDAASRYN